MWLAMVRDKVIINEFKPITLVRSYSGFEVCLVSVRSQYVSHGLAPAVCNIYAL